MLVIYYLLSTDTVLASQSPQWISSLAQHPQVLSLCRSRVTKDFKERIFLKIQLFVPREQKHPATVELAVTGEKKNKLSSFSSWFDFRAALRELRVE